MAHPFVWYQIVERSDDVASVISRPAVVTSRQMRGQPGSDKLVEVVSLTVFHPGAFEFVAEVHPWSDEHGPTGASYRDIDAEPPSIDKLVKEAAKRKAAMEEASNKVPNLGQPSIIERVFGSE